VVSWNCSWATSGGWSFFSVLGLVLQAGELVDQGDELFGQRLEAPVIIHVVLDLGGLIRRHALGELFTAQEALQDVIRAARGGVRLKAPFGSPPAAFKSRARTPKTSGSK